MKRFLMFFLCMFSFWVCANSANAQVRIGVTLNAPGVIVNDTEQLGKLDIRLAELLSTDKYEVLPVQVLIQKEIEYRRKKNIFQAPNQLTPQPLSMEALCELGKDNKCDYVIMISMQAAEGKGGFLYVHGEKRMDLITDLAITDISTKTNVFQKKYKNGGMDAGPVFTRKEGDAGKALVKAFDKFLKKLEIVPGKDIP